MHDNAQKYGLARQNVPGDGNCFFHAVFKQLPDELNNQYQSEVDIITAATNHIVEHFENYRNFIDDGVEVDQLLNRFYEGEEWADNVMIQATARILNCNLVIVRDDAAEPTIMRQGEAMHNIILGYEVGFYYQALIPADPRNLERDLLIDNAPIDTANPLKLQEHCAPGM